MIASWTTIDEGQWGPRSWSSDELCQGYQLIQKLGTKRVLSFEVNVDEQQKRDHL